MAVPRRLREIAGSLTDIEDDDIELDEDEAQAFRALLLAALDTDPAVKAAVRRAAGPAAKPVPRGGRRG